ncbi:MAG: TetR/AcrR family transcriptional regulator [Kangiellaceae bacterium]
MNSTKTKILNEAERLFAEQGFAETSLRMITAKAKVNLASVNYHFGSKKTLIQAVFERFMDRICHDLNSEMDRLEAQQQAIHVSSVLQMLKQPIKNLDKLRPDGAGVFMNLLGRSYAETQGHIRRFAMERYANVFNRFVGLLNSSSPQCDASEMFWRLHFMLGSFIFSLAGHRALQEIAESDYNQRVSIEQIVDKLVPFMSAAFSQSVNA